jgi:glycerol-3-phosphate dehydrogenase (NAD(P)+)
MKITSHVTIVGAGDLGKAVGLLIGKKGVAPDLWDANPATVPNQKPLEEIIPSAQYIFFCVPSWAMRAAVTAALPHLAPGTVVVSFAKGLEKDSLQTMAEMVPTVLPPAQPFVVVGGPMLAEEIVAGRAAVGIFASKDEVLAKAVGALFASDDFRVETTTDAFSVSLASVLKNIYAVALGIADGLDLSGNEKGWVAARAISEMRAIAVALTADPDAILGTAGVGDLIATGYSVYSRNRETGIEIVETGKCNIRGEGLNALPFLIQRLGKGKAATFPLLMLINTIGIECRPASQAFEAFLKG